MVRHFQRLMMIAADKINLYTDDEILDILDEVWANPYTQPIMRRVKRLLEGYE